MEFKSMYQYSLFSNGLLVVTGTVCQIAVVLAIKRNPRIRNGPFSLISNLTYVQLAKEWWFTPVVVASFLMPNNDILCKTWMFLWLATDHAAFVLLTAIAVDRYLSIVHPLKAVTISEAFRKRAPFVACFLGVVLSLPVIFAVGINEIESNHKDQIQNKTNYACTANVGDLGKISFVTFVCTGFLGPFLVSAFCYARIAHVIWTRRKTFPSTAFSNQQKSKLKIVKMAVTVLLLGEVTWMPFAIGVIFEVFNIVEIFSEAHIIYMITATNLVFLGGIIIPFVYASFSPEFRASFKTIFRFKRNTNSSHLYLKPEKVNNVHLKSFKIACEVP